MTELVVFGKSSVNVEKAELLLDVDKARTSCEVEVEYEVVCNVVEDVLAATAETACDVSNDVVEEMETSVVELVDEICADVEAVVVLDEVVCVEILLVEESVLADAEAANGAAPVMVAEVQVRSSLPW